MSASAKYQFEIKHNCLLTKLPLLLIDYRKTFLHSGAFSKTACDFLSAHGYKVNDLCISGFTQKMQIRRTKHLLKRLIESQAHCHVILLNPPQNLSIGTHENLHIFNSHHYEELLPFVMRIAEVEFTTGPQSQQNYFEFHP